MSDLVIGEKKKKSITVRGQKIEMRRPSMKDQLVYEEALNKAQNKEGSAIKAMTDFLVNLGMPEELAMDFDSEEYGQVIEYLVSSKKN